MDYESAPSGTLRQKVLQGSLYLMGRQGASVVIGLIGMFLLTRIVGPGVYGVYTAALGVFNYLIWVGLMGTHVYLIRERQDTPKEWFHLAFWWLLFWGIGLSAIVAITLLLVGHYWVRTGGFLLASITMCAMLPLSLIAYVPAAQLERELNYRRVALIEAGSTLTLYTIAIPLALIGHGLLALLAGFIASQIWLLVGFFFAARYRPAWYWEGGQLRTMLGYSISQAASRWIYGVRNLAPSLLVLPLAGEAAAGYLAITDRLIGILSVAIYTTQRITVPAFARIQDNLPRLRRAVNEAMQLQTLALGLFFVGFVLVSPYALPRLLGAKWDPSLILPLFVILAVRHLLAALFGVQGSALYVKKENLTMLYANIAFAITFGLLATVLMIGLPPSYRLYGYLAAEFIAHLPNYLIIDRRIRKVIGSPDYRIVALWIGAITCLLIAPLVSWWFSLAGALLLLSPPSRRQIAQHYKELRRYRDRETLFDE
jgi:PST family polysaccharide transporter